MKTAKKKLVTLTSTLFIQKQVRRKKLSQLPFEKKIDILIQLQVLASGVHDATHRSSPAPWPLD
jgi:hypothetical protein